jgi:hypothetical protein
MSVLSWAVHAAIALMLTVLTQIGGVIYLAALAVRARVPIIKLSPRWDLVITFGIIYVFAWFPMQALATLSGRVPLPCAEANALRVASPITCILHRHYVSAEMHALAIDVAHAMDERFPGTITQTLDANFPFFDGFPLAPHLSHDDGDKLDLALYYANAEGDFAPGALRSPIGYWAFEEPGDDERQPCRGRGSLLRWDQDWFQIFTRGDLVLDGARTRAALIWLRADGRSRRAFLEPHLVDRLELDSSFVRFQGCNAARHDDHFHIELR